MSLNDTETITVGMCQVDMIMYRYAYTWISFTNPYMFYLPFRTLVVDRVFRFIWQYWYPVYQDRTLCQMSFQ